MEVLAKDRVGHPPRYKVISGRSRSPIQVQDNPDEGEPLAPSEVNMNVVPEASDTITRQMQMDEWVWVTTHRDSLFSPDELRKYLFQTLDLLHDFHLPFQHTILECLARPKAITQLKAMVNSDWVYTETFSEMGLWTHGIPFNQIIAKIGSISGPSTRAYEQTIFRAFFPELKDLRAYVLKVTKVMVWIFDKQEKQTQQTIQDSLLAILGAVSRINRVLEHYKNDYAGLRESLIRLCMLVEHAGKYPDLKEDLAVRELVEGILKCFPIAHAICVPNGRGKYLDFPLGMSHKKVGYLFNCEEDTGEGCEFGDLCGLVHKGRGGNNHNDVKRTLEETVNQKVKEQREAAEREKLMATARKIVDGKIGPPLGNLTPYAPYIKEIEEQRAAEQDASMVAGAEAPALLTHPGVHSGPQVRPHRSEANGQTYEVPCHLPASLSQPQGPRDIDQTSAIPVNTSVSPASSNANVLAGLDFATAEAKIVPKTRPPGFFQGEISNNDPSAMPETINNPPAAANSTRLVSIVGDDQPASAYIPSLQQASPPGFVPPVPINDTHGLFGLDFIARLPPKPAPQWTSAVYSGSRNTAFDDMDDIRSAFSGSIQPKYIRTGGTTPVPALVPVFEGEQGLHPSMDEQPLIQFDTIPQSTTSFGKVSGFSKTKGNEPVLHPPDTLLPTAFTEQAIQGSLPPVMDSTVNTANRHRRRPSTCFGSDKTEEDFFDPAAKAFADTKTVDPVITQEQQHSSGQLTPNYTSKTTSTPPLATSTPPPRLASAAVASPPLVESHQIAQRPAVTTSTPPLATSTPAPPLIAHPPPAKTDRASQSVHGGSNFSIHTGYSAPRILNCGHSERFSSAQGKCKQQVEFKWACGHSIHVACHSKNKMEAFDLGGSCQQCKLSELVAGQT